MRRSRRERYDRFFWWIFGIAAGSSFFIWTLAIVLQEHADYHIGYDIQTLRSTDALVTSFVESVHANDPDAPEKMSLANKWVKPVVITLVGESPDWHRRVIFEHVSLLRKLTGLVIREVESRDESATLKIHFVQGTKAILETGRRYTSNDTWNEDFLRGHKCFAIFSANSRDEITSGANIISRMGRDSYTRRCLIEELTQVIGPSHDNAIYRPSIFSNRYLPDRLTINDNILVRTLYDPRIKPGMTRKETEPIAREIIEKLVAAVKKRGEVALYQ